MEITSEQKIEMGAKILCAIISNPELYKNMNLEQTAMLAWDYADEYCKVVQKKTEQPSMQINKDLARQLEQGLS